MAQLKKRVSEVHSRYRERTAREGILGAELKQDARELELERRKARKLNARISAVADKVGGQGKEGILSAFCKQSSNLGVLSHAERFCVSY